MSRTWNALTNEQKGWVRELSRYVEREESLVTDFCSIQVDYETGEVYERVENLGHLCKGDLLGTLPMKAIPDRKRNLSLLRKLQNPETNQGYLNKPKQPLVDENGKWLHGPVY